MSHPVNDVILENINSYIGCMTVDEALEYIKNNLTHNEYESFLLLIKRMVVSEYEKYPDGPQ